VGLASEILGGLTRCLHAHAGFDLPDWVVEARALERMEALDLGAQAYLDLVRSPRGAAELAALVEALRVGETRFFRHRPHVDALLDVVVPAWRARDERSPRIWSAGCATGEEAYTLALVLGRALPRPAFRTTILGTDVSEEALSTARAAAYPVSVLEGIPEPWRDGLIRDGDVARIRPEIAALCSFRQKNLADPDLPRGFDLVWCRNVLIYFGPEARMRVLERLVLALEPGGFLFVGYSESLRDVPGLRAVRHADQVLYEKAPAHNVHAKPAAPTPARAPTPVPRPAGGPRLTPTPAAPRPAASALIAAAGRPASRPAFKSSPELTRAKAATPAGASLPRRGRAGLPIRTSDPSALAAEIRAAMSAPGLGTLTLDLDAADYLDDAVAPVLKRAVAVAESAGIELLLHATRPGPQRWLRRNGLAGGGE
jgi:chemotaxis protein methyltransferase CheR